MAMRSAWEGYLRLNLISVPVKAYSALSSTRNGVSFHQIHQKCHSRIRYKKVCPLHGEVTNEEIVSGYEVGKDQHVLVDRKVIDEARTNADKAINIDVFVPQNEIDPAYFTDRTYYLTPDGKVAQKPYAVLHQVMAEEKCHGIASMVVSGREHIALVRPLEHLLAVTLLHYDDQVKKPSGFEDELSEPEVSNDELRLARSLVEASLTTNLDLAKYKDEYTGKLMKHIEASAAGKKLALSERTDGPAVINFMDALRESLRKAKSSAHGKPAKTRQKPAARAGSKSTRGSRRKTG